MKTYEFPNHLGIALTQILLAIALGSIVCIGVVSHYQHVSETEAIRASANQIIKIAENSAKETASGRISNPDYTINGMTISARNGIATVTSLKPSDCQALEALLSSKGVVNGICDHVNGQNQLVFHTKNISLSIDSNASLTVGTPDNSNISIVNEPTLSGTTVVSGSALSTGNSSGTFSSTASNQSGSLGLSGTGSNATVNSGGASTPSGVLLPINATGNATTDTCTTSTTINWKVSVVGASGPNNGSGVCQYSYQAVAGGAGSCPWTTVMSIPMNQPSGWPCPLGNNGCYYACNGPLGTNNSKTIPPRP